MGAVVFEILLIPEYEILFITETSCVVQYTVGALLTQTEQSTPATYSDRSSILQGKPHREDQKKA